MVCYGVRTILLAEREVDDGACEGPETCLEPGLPIVGFIRHTKYDFAHFHLAM